MAAGTVEKTQLHVGTRTVDLEIYAPESDAPAPAILVLHEIFGVRDWYREDAQDLANRGYLVYMPNLYTGGTMRYCIRAMILEAGRNNHGDSDVNQEIHAILDAMKADERCNGAMGMIGMCLTGGYVLHMAQRDDMLAPVVYHHSLGNQGAGVAKGDNLDKVTRLQGHFAKKDLFCPAKRREKLAKELGDRLVRYEYDMPHGFRSMSRNKPEAPLVWERTLEFFDTHLR